MTPEFKHTSGPWGFDSEAGEVTTVNRIKNHLAPIANVEIGWDEPFETEQQANAVLIASAPELLTACEISIYHLEAALGPMNPACKAMRKAIANAKGDLR